MTSYLKKKKRETKGKTSERKQFQKRAPNVKKQSNGRIYQYLWIRGDNAEWRPPIFAPFESIFGEKVQPSSLSAEFSPLFISVFCELSRGRCKFSSFYLSSPDKVSEEPRQHARYRHVEAIYGFRLFRTRLCAFCSSTTRNTQSTFFHSKSRVSFVRGGGRGGKGGSLCCEDHFSRITWNDLHDDVNVAVNLGRGMKQFQIFCPSLINCAPIYRKNLFVSSFQ